jgi:hypothetical protein
MSGKKTSNVPIAQGIDFSLSGDLKNVALVFKLADGALPVAFPADKMGHVIATLIQAAQEVAARSPTPAPVDQSQQAKPIDTLALAIGPGRTESEALLTVKVGPLDLTFATELSTLMVALHKLQSMTRATEGSPPKAN